jgi:hypothetical protein
MESRSKGDATLKQAEDMVKEPQVVNEICAEPETKMADVALVPDRRMGTTVATEGTIGPLASQDGY